LVAKFTTFLFFSVVHGIYDLNSNITFIIIIHMKKGKKGQRLQLED